MFLGYVNLVALCVSKTAVGPSFIVNRFPTPFAGLVQFFCPETTSATRAVDVRRRTVSRLPKHHEKTTTGLT